MFEDAFLQEEADNNPPPIGCIFTVRAWLQITFGAQNGQDIYDRLKDAAIASADYNGLGGRPGIVFDDNGGEFVSLDDPIT